MMLRLKKVGTVCIESTQVLDSETACVAPARVLVSEVAVCTFNSHGVPEMLKKFVVKRTCK